jgi:hypothetical protein
MARVALLKVCCRPGRHKRACVCGFAFTSPRRRSPAAPSPGGTCVLASVFGPVLPTRAAKEQIDRATIDVVFKPHRGVGGPVEAERERVVRCALESVVLTQEHPRTVIQVVVQVVSDDGAVLAAGLVAACMALMDAGVGMSGLVGAVAVAVGADGALLLDPVAAELAPAAAARGPRAAPSLFSHAAPVLPASSSAAMSDAAAEAATDAPPASLMVAFRSGDEGVLACLATGALSDAHFLLALDAARR